MDFMYLIHPIFKWLHVIAGIMWIGLLYFFNFVNSGFAPTMDGDTKKKVVPELMPRSLYWFRWGAAYTWITGLVLLLVVYYHGGLTFDDPDMEYGVPFIVMVAVTFLAVYVYDALYNSPIAANPRQATVISFILIAVIIFLMKEWAGFSYRSYNIHLGALFGTSMAFNVWFRIWPAQQKIINAIKNGDAPDGDLLALAGLRSKHNTYMSVPLVWTMHNQHHADVLSGGKFGIPSEWSWVVLMVFVALGWHIVFQMYKKASTVSGF